VSGGDPQEAGPPPVDDVAPLRDTRPGLAPPVDEPVVEVPTEGRPPSVAPVPYPRAARSPYPPPPAPRTPAGGRSPASFPRKEMISVTDHTIALKGAMQIEGALGVALVDSTSGMALGTAGSPMDLDLDVAAAGNSNVVQAKLRTMADLGLQQTIEDILITLDKQYHIIRPLRRNEGIFLYLVLDRARANLAMARYKLAGLEKDLKV
jgi:hypothetical protein